ncbi:hypothetical protein [Synechococcus sp. H65.1]
MPANSLKVTHRLCLAKMGTLWESALQQAFDGDSTVLPVWEELID